MKLFIPGPIPDHARNIMRRLGYGEQRARSGQISYVRRVSSERFPRFHVYVEDMGGGIQVNLHVDQKEATYEGAHAHSGEYEGSLVEREMAAIHAFVTSLKSTGSQTTEKKVVQSKKKTGFISKFF